ncbi:MAG TPA: 3-hydroxyacyl-CoA dehydrogenase NAD-binding domain-containing protein [Solirubrobacteraceae bacterium]|nr:3-hydroxyacyl-CoA dehydrogenase NAD-binding domain-containing protein [Solirubrobacteraceae bacterium]
MTAQAPRSAAVLGAGTIGLSAAVWLAAHGTEVTVIARRLGTVGQRLRAARSRAERLRSLGALNADQAHAVHDHLQVTVGPPSGVRFALVLEAVAENLELKREVLAGAEVLLDTDGVIATTTSSLPVAELAASLRRPERFAAWHWFHPADLIELVEIVPATTTAPDTTARLAGWSAALGKRPIILRLDTPGFVANRLQYALLREAYALVEAGICDVADIDTAVTAALGARWAAIGPFATMDLAGLGVHAAVAEGLFPALSNTGTVPDTLARLTAQNAGGAREGRGLLGRYEPGQLERVEEARDRTLVSLGRGRARS